MKKQVSRTRGVFGKNEIEKKREISQKEGKGRQAHGINLQHLASGRKFQQRMTKNLNRKALVQIKNIRKILNATRSKKKPHVHGREETKQAQEREIFESGGANP